LQGLTVVIPRLCRPVSTGDAGVSYPVCSSLLPDNQASSRTLGAQVAQPLQIEELDRNLRARGQIDSQHALRLRQLIYAKDKVGQGDAEVLFRLDHACTEKHPAFAALYVEVLTDYFVWQVEPRGHVSEAQARYLIDNVMQDAHVSSRTELELLLNIVHYAHSVPDELSLLVLGVATRGRAALRPQ
jgi:hypothetical protein